MTGFHRVAVAAAMKSTARTDARPPQIVRRPRSVPLSRASGATPTSAAISFRLKRPSSGNSARSVRLVIGPIPGTLCNRSSWARHKGLARTAWSRSRSTPPSWRSSQRMWSVRLRRMARRARPSRFCSAISISMSWRRRVTKASKLWRASSGSGRGSGRTRSANRASTAASMASVFANWPVARAKSRTCRGFATTTATPALASAAATVCSYPPVASRTTSTPPSSLRRCSNASMPRGSWATCQRSPLGRHATSKVALATSIPTNTVAAVMRPPVRKRLASTRPCTMRAWSPRQLFGLATSKRRTTPLLKAGLLDPGHVGLSPACGSRLLMMLQVYRDTRARIGAASRVSLQVPHRHPTQQLRPDHQRLLVDIEAGAVVRRGRAGPGRRSDEGEAAGDLLQEIRHVLPAHRAVAGLHVVRSDDLSRDLGHQRGHARVVDQRAGEPAIAHLGARAERRRDALRRLVHERRRIIPELAAERPHRAAQVGAAGDHIERVSSVDLCDRDDAFLQGMAAPRHQALKAGDDVGRNENGIDGLVRGGGVAAAAQDRDLELVHRRHYRTGHHAHGAGRQVVPQMDPERGVDLGGVERAVGDHRLRAVRDFLGGLKRELHRSAEPQRTEPPRHLEPDRHVPVVPAGVHLAWMPGAVRDVVRFLDRERVHISADQHAGVAIAGAAATHRDDARLPDTRLHFIAEALESLGGERGRPGLLEAQLRVLVQVAAGGDELDPVHRWQGQWHGGLRFPRGVAPGSTHPFILSSSDKVCLPRTPRILAAARCTPAGRAGSACATTRSTCPAAAGPSGPVRSSPDRRAA